MLSDQTGDGLQCLTSMEEAKPQYADWLRS